MAALDYWELTPAETTALADAWKQREKLDSKRFTALLSCITGQQIDTPEDESERESELKHAADLIEQQKRKNG